MKKTLWLVRNPTIGLSQPLIHVVQNRNDALGLSEKTTLFVFSQCVSCSPAWWFCTAWGTDYKEPFSLLCLLLNLLFVGSTTLYRFVAVKYIDIVNIGGYFEPELCTSFFF